MAIEARTILLEAIGDTRNARRELERLEDKVRGLDGETEVSIRAETTRAQRRLGEFEAKLKTIDRTRVSPEVSVELGKALAELAVMRARLTALGNAKTKVDVELRRNILREVLDLERGILRMTGALDKASRPARTFGDALGDVVQTIKSVTPIVNGMAILIGVKLVAGLLAVGASAAAAVGGIFALGAALLASLGPAIALAIAVVSRLAAIFDVMGKQKAAADQAKAQALTGSSQNAAAAAQEEAAARSIADAHREAGRAAEEVSRATVAAYEEMRQAAEDVQEAVEGVQNADLGLDQARLDVDKAKQALAEFADQANVSRGVFERFTNIDAPFDREALQGALSGQETGDKLELEQLILNVRKAKQGEKDATDDLKDSERTLADARRRNNQFMRNGIAASPGYVSALQAQQDANRNLRRAIDDARSGSDSLIASQAAAIVQAGKLSGAEKRLLEVLKQLKPALRALFSDATNAVIGSIAGALDRLSILFLPLKGAIGELGGAWADLITTLSKEFVKPAWIGAFMAFFHLAAQLTKVIGGEVFVQFLRIIRNIALVAGPLLVQVFKQFAHWLGGVAGSTANLERMRKIVGIMVEGFKVWAGFLGAIIDLFIGLVEAAGPIGNEFVKWLTDGVRAFTKWLKSAEGQKEVREFFEDTLPAVKALIGFIFRLVKVFARVLQITAPLTKGFIDGLNFFLDLLLLVLGVVQDITHLPFVKWVLELVGNFLAFGTVGKIIKGVFSALSRLGGAVGLLKGLGKILTKPFTQAFDFIIRLVAKFSPKLAAKLQVAVLNALKFMRDKLSAFAKFGGEIVGRIVRGIKDVGKKILDGAKWLIEKYVAGLRAVWGKIFEAGKAIVERLIRGIKRVASTVFDVGKQLLSGLIRGFTTIGGKVFSAIKGLVNKIVDAVKDFLGIHSPSRVFMSIGEQMLAGLIKGFTSGNVVDFIKAQLGGLEGLAIKIATSTPHLLGPGGLPQKLLELGIGGLGNLVGLAKGGIVTDNIFAELGEKGKEAVVPLTSHVLRQLADAIASKMTFPGTGSPSFPRAASPALAAAGSGGVHIDNVNLPAPPAGGIADARYQAVQLVREVRRRGR